MLPLELPTLQNWSCHNCGGCCKQHAIEVTAAEYARIEQQNWRGQPGFEADQPIFEKHSGFLFTRSYRLAHRADGSCVFLDENGLCRIHAKFGENAKPLACRIYPYAFHPAGKRVAVSLRFSCPSVVANQGRSLNQSQTELRELQKLVVPEGQESTSPPPVTSTEKLAWPDFYRIVDALVAGLKPADVPLPLRVLRMLFWLRLVEQAQFAKIQGQRVQELLQLITAAAAVEVPADFKSTPEPSSIGKTHFRLLGAQYARKDTGASAHRTWRYRWQLLRGAWRFARGTGQTPEMQPLLPAVPFENLEQSYGAWPAGVDELLTRYLRVKLQGLHFCGPAYYDIPLVEGFYSLVLMLPVCGWLARWLATAAGRTTWNLADFQQALAIADHHHGYAPPFGTYGFRSRVRTLAQLGDLERLLVWYLR